MVVRAYPIRVAGDSGPLPNEIDWPTVRADGDHDHNVVEYTSVTHRERRVARFDAAVVRGGITINSPTTIAMNHVDYVDHAACGGQVTRRVLSFLETIEQEIGRPIDFVGLTPSSLVATRHGSRRIRAATG